MKFQVNLPYLGYNTVLRTLEIRHYGPVCDVSETGSTQNFPNSMTLVIFPGLSTDSKSNNIIYNTIIIQL